MPLPPLCQHMAIQGPGSSSGCSGRPRNRPSIGRRHTGCGLDARADICHRTTGGCISSSAEQDSRLTTTTAMQVVNVVTPCSALAYLPMVPHPSTMVEHHVPLWPLPHPCLSPYGAVACAYPSHVTAQCHVPLWPFPHPYLYPYSTTTCAHPRPVTTWHYIPLRPLPHLYTVPMVPCPSPIPRRHWPWGRLGVICCT